MIRSAVQVRNEAQMVEVKVCNVCKVEKPLKDFYKHKNLPQGRQRACKVCKASIDQTYNKKNLKGRNIQRVVVREQWRQTIREIKVAAGCAKCGEAKWYMLDFHHKDPSKKEFEISNINQDSITKTKQEIKKCIVLCSNHHREFHHLEKRDKITLKQYLNGSLAELVDRASLEN